ncbi:hypothetical protein [Dactylosporangium sp. CA-092794]|uniref:hypothetical protein n=1 Tax=Dactylosporangium sp. CA-092794 TaxID=3239929 RepID=UPI003D934027
MYADAVLPAVTVTVTVSGGPDGPAPADVPDPRVAVIEIRSAGHASIPAADVHVPLTVTLTGRQVISADIVDAEPCSVIRLIADHGPLHHEGGTITLPPIPMNPADEIRLVALLSGAQAGITCDGHIHGARISRVVGNGA